MKQIEERILALLGIELQHEQLRGNMMLMPLIWVLQSEMLGMSKKYIAQYYGVPVLDVITGIYNEYKKIASDKHFNDRYKFVRQSLGKPLR